MSFYNISKKILQATVAYKGQKITFVFDRYFKPSTKYYERTLRGIEHRNYMIRRPEQSVA